MTVVRELVTLLGFTVDKAAYDKASKAYDQLTGQMTQQQKAAQGVDAAVGKTGKSVGSLGQALGMVQRFAAQAGLSMLLKEYIGLASDANETKGALGQLFGPEGLAQVTAWSQEMGAAMGRSENDLQSYVSRLGSVLGPVTESREEAQKMAQTMSALAVDLGSFFNTTDQEAMMALRSALTGEYESMKRYGVVINEATLQEVAHAKGIRKKTTQMTSAEKTQIRYAAIMERTKTAQGDAQRTGQGFANASKALAAQLKDLGINMAQTVMPYAEKLVRWARDGLTAFNKMTQGTHLLETAMYALVAVAGALALEFYGAFVLPALAIAALILVVDDLWTTLEGGQSVMRGMLDSLLGVEKAAELIKTIQYLGAKGMWETFAAGVDNVGFAVQRLIEKFIDLLGWLNPVEAGLRILDKFGVIDRGAQGRATRRGLDAPVAGSISEELALRQRDQARAIQSGIAARAEKKRAEQFGPRQYSTVPLTAAPPMGYGVLAAPGEGGPGAAPTVNLAAPTIIINGGDEAKVKRVVTETMEAERKKTIAAVGGRGRS